MGRFHHHGDGSVHEHRDLGDHTGYPETGSERVMVLESILAENDRVAAMNQPFPACRGSPSTSCPRLGPGKRRC